MFIKKRRVAGQKKYGRNSFSSVGANNSSKKGGFFGNNNGTSSARPSSFQRTHRNGSKGKRSRGENLDISRFIQKSSPLEQRKIEIKNSFADFDLSQELKNNLKKRNYITPTPIQDQAINYLLKNRDLIGLASTGTGKTAAFLLPLINKVFKNREEKVLIIAPTRELAIQIENEFRQFSWAMQIFSAVCVGGSPIYKQINNLKRNPNFVIGTPGRLKDLSERNLINFASFKNIVLDEVDRMLDMGFIDDIKGILDKMPSEKQSLFFSATLPPRIRELIQKFLRDPITIEISTGRTAENVDQDVVRVRDKAMKFNQLQELLSEPELKKVLIFSETKREVEKLAITLVKEGFKAESIHGDKKQHQRQRALNAFKDGYTKILVATDVAARGIDVKDITHVINYTVPQTYDDYIHRIGRTGRCDKKGCALTFVEVR